MSDIQKIHLIAIGGSVMHNLAIELSLKGHIITGSDDSIEEPSKSQLSQHNLLPAQLGWFPEKINSQLDSVILGMHAKNDNPELLKAKDLGLPILSYPELIARLCKDKQRIVIGGSHGKTTITAIAIHVVNYHKRKFDYLIGAKVEGLESSLKLSDDPTILIEGDEYLSSPTDHTPKFLMYNHHMAVISGISWDHANVFPKKEDYIKQFETFADRTPRGGTLIYNAEDPIAEAIGKIERPDFQVIPYKTHDHTVEDGAFYLNTGDNAKLPVQIFGKHNMQNISAAKELLRKIGITSNQFYEALPSFKGAKGRLELVAKQEHFCFYKDFAHAPSKVKATCEAVKVMYPKRLLVGCLELHTFSSLNKSFLPEYTGSMNSCDESIVYFNPSKVSQKKLEPISEVDIQATFGKSVRVFTNRVDLENHLMKNKWNNKNLLLMSSGDFDGLDLDQLSNKLTL